MGSAAFGRCRQGLRKGPALTEAWHISPVINCSKVQPIATAALVKALSPNKPRELGSQPSTFAEVSGFS